MKNQPGGGSAAKMTLWEGGHRVVGLAHWPGTIAPGVSGALASSLDYIPTVLSFAGVALPTDRSFDGIDLTALLISPDSQRNNASAHSTLFHPLSGACGSGDLMAARVGRYKAHWITGGANGCMGSTTPACITHSPPLLFDVGGEDPAEAHALDTALPQYAVVVKQLEDAPHCKVGQHCKHASPRRKLFNVGCRQGSKLLQQEEPRLRVQRQQQSCICLELERKK